MATLLTVVFGIQPEHFLKHWFSAIQLYVWLRMNLWARILDLCMRPPSQLYCTVLVDCGYCRGWYASIWLSQVRTTWINWARQNCAWNGTEPNVVAQYLLQPCKNAFFPSLLFHHLKIVSSVRGSLEVGMTRICSESIEIHQIVFFCCSLVKSVLLIGCFILNTSQSVVSFVNSLILINLIIFQLLLHSFFSM